MHSQPLRRFKQKQHGQWRKAIVRLFSRRPGHIELRVTRRLTDRISWQSRQSLFERAARYHRLTLDVTQRLEESLEFLEQFACACRARDGRKAATAVIATLERAAEYILESRPTRVDDTPARQTPPLIT